jgi:hypothetical protein
VLERGGSADFENVPVLLAAKSAVASQRFSEQEWLARMLRCPILFS